MESFQSFFYLAGGIGMALVALLAIILLAAVIVFAFKLNKFISRLNKTIDELSETFKDMGEDVREKVESLSIIGSLAEGISFFRHLFQEKKKEKKNKKDNQ